MTPKAFICRPCCVSAAIPPSIEPSWRSSFFVGQPLEISIPNPPSGEYTLKRPGIIVSNKLSGLEEAVRIQMSRELHGSIKLRKWPPLRRGKVSGRLPVPDRICRPPYVDSCLLPELSREHQLHDDEGISRMKASCELAARVLDYAGTLVRGYHGDTSKTFLCGNVNELTKRLVKVAEECLERAIYVCKDGANFKKIGKRISEHAEKYGYGVMEHFVGHGVGTVFRSEPLILHHRNDESGCMVEGETFTIG